MSRLPLSFTLCSLIVGTALLAAPNVQAKDSEIKDGIPGIVVKVDAAQGTVTIAEKEGRERTYTVNQETQIIGPRGGIVHSRLHDHRFHAGLPITVVANGTTAAELHLGYDRKARAGRSTSSRAAQRPPQLKHRRRPIRARRRRRPIRPRLRPPPPPARPASAESRPVAQRLKTPRRKRKTKTTNSRAR